MNKLVVGNLVHRPLRSVISAFAVAIEVIMILSITAILMGKLNGFKDRTNGIGMDMFVRPSTTNNFIGMSPAGASIKVADIIAKIPHVAVAAPVNIQITSSFDNIYGIDFQSYDALLPFVFQKGGPFQGPYDIIVDDYIGAGKNIGDSIKVIDHTFRICGIVNHGKGGRKFIPIDTMGKITFTEGKATAFYLRTETPPKYEDQVKQDILATPGMQSYNVVKTQEYLNAMTPDTLTPAFNIGLEVVIGIAVVIGFLVIFQSMYTAVMERTREIGILKSMGASRTYIVAIVLSETGLLAACGIILGIGASFALSGVLNAKFPTLDFVINIPYVWKAIVIAFAGALLGAFYPALKAARKDPIDALSYE
ncbi:ABC transporter permease [Granulicella arctica]|uniref:Putative ABC transport system permease protein n=1 Tax=Granulicella arctica TaxID=940613 RepID=A0A7Y9TSR1_9BACT|nr:FtsX-like permease family protein [Granulicella arctica]NYF79258.1 putative ABC transport system permease protein [Granulicella arctica]